MAESNADDFPDYPVGAVKYNPVTKSSAIRTVWPKNAFNAWGVMTVDRGGYLADYNHVQTWPDVTDLPTVETEDSDGEEAQASTP